MLGIALATLFVLVGHAAFERIEVGTVAVRQINWGPGSGLEHRDYLSEHAFLVIPIEPEYLRGVTDVATYIDGGELP